MMEWYWYIARSNEIFCDLDNKIGGPLRRVLVARARLRGAIAANTLSVRDYYLYQSVTPYHYHLMVRLDENLSELERIIWSSRLCDDEFRSVMNMARLVDIGRSWSLLISPKRRTDFYREPDYVCRCLGKHRQEVMAACPIAIKLDCVLTADHFGNPVYLDDPITEGKQQ